MPIDVALFVVLAMVPLFIGSAFFLVQRKFQEAQVAFLLSITIMLIPVALLLNRIATALSK